MEVLVFSFLDQVPGEKLLQSATYASVTVAVILIVLKGFAWWVTGSLSVQASLIDSVLDAVTSFINLLAVRAALQPADQCHRFGHGKAESIAGLLQSVFIALSACWLLAHAVEHLLTPQPIQKTVVGIWVTGVALVLTVLLITYQAYVIRRSNSLAISADRLHYLSDILTNIAVLVSLVLTSTFAWYWADALLGGLIALYILKTSWDIGYEAVHVLMDRELSDEARDNMLKVIFQDPCVKGVQDLRTRTSGTHKFIQGHVLFEKGTSLEQVTRCLITLSNNLQQTYPEADIIFQPILETQQKDSMILKEDGVIL